MEKLDKVIAGLEVCGDETAGCILPNKCPYSDVGDSCIDRLLTDALELLKSIPKKCDRNDG